MRRFLLSMIASGLLWNVGAQEMVLANNIQTKPNDSLNRPIDGYYRNTDMEGRKAVAFATLRTADVVYRTCIWREIDLRDKMNSVFVSPKARLMDIILNAIKLGELTAYDPTPTYSNPTGDNFEFMAELSIADVMLRLGGDSILVEEFNAQNEVVRSYYERKNFNGEDIVKFRIKEDWVFDKQRSVFEPRIVGIAPLINVVALSLKNKLPISEMDIRDDPFMVQSEHVNSGERTRTIDSVLLNTSTDFTPAFWIYFPEARSILVNKAVMSGRNTAAGLSYDDIFINRLFASYIVKQDNPEDIRIRDYISTEVDQIIESERIQKALLDWEQNLWSH